MHNATEREKFKGCMNMLHIEQVRGKKSKADQNKFIIRARNVKDNNMREYMFRCENEKVIQICILLFVFVFIFVFIVIQLCLSFCLFV